MQIFTQVDNQSQKQINIIYFLKLLKKTDLNYKWITKEEAKSCDYENDVIYVVEPTEG